MHINLVLPFMVLLYTIILCGKCSIGLRFDLFPDDVKNVVDDNIITPGRNTLLSIISRKIGLVDFFVNLIRGTKRTFFTSHQKQQRKPSYRYPQQTALRYGPTMYKDITTYQPYTESTPSRDGIYLMTAPQLPTSTHSLFNPDITTSKSIENTKTNFSTNANSALKFSESKLHNMVMQKIISNPTVINPLLKTIMSVTHHKDKDIEDNIKSGFEYPDTSQKFAIPPLIYKEMRKKATSPIISKNVHTLNFPPRKYRKVEHFVQSQYDTPNLYTGKQNLFRIPSKSVLLSSKQYFSTTNLLDASTYKQLDYHSFEHPVLRPSETMLVLTTPKVRQNIRDFRSTAFQVLARTDRPALNNDTNKSNAQEVM